MTPYKKPADILLVEDQAGDVELIREALKQGGYDARLHVAEDGEQALDYLLRRHAHSQADRPDLVLLDLTLPRIGGKDVLRQAKTHPGLCDIPVIVLTGSESEEDLMDACSEHANCYIAKPMGLEDSMQVLQAVLHFWLEVAQLPRFGASPVL